MTSPDHGPDNGATQEPRSPVDDHLDVDTVADLIENLLPAGEAHRARDHVKGCPDCQRTYDALIELSADLAEEGRAEISMPAQVAERLDQVIASEAMLRSSTVGVHSLAQFTKDRRRLPRLLLGAAAVVLVCAVGVGVLLSVSGESGGNTAGIQPSRRPNSPSQVTTLSNLTTGEVGVTVQRLLEGTTGQIVIASGDEARCAAQFATGQPNRTLRLVQAALVEGRRSTVIAMQSGSSQDVRVYVVTGCDTRGAVGTDASVAYVTTVTLRSR
jgi:hypothetical protein